MLKKHRNPLLAVKTSVPTPRTVPENRSPGIDRARCEAEELRERLPVINEMDPNDQIRRELRTIREVLERERMDCMGEFLKFMDELRQQIAFHMEITYSKMFDWSIFVWIKGCAGDYPASERKGSDAVVCKVEDIDMELCAARAHVKVKEWLIINRGGY